MQKYDNFLRFSMFIGIIITLVLKRQFFYINTTVTVLSSVSRLCSSMLMCVMRVL